MLRHFEYATPANYKDFRNNLYSLDLATFDFPNDKVTIGGTAYRISTIQQIGNNLSSNYPNIVPFYQSVLATGSNIVFPYTLGSLGSDYALKYTCWNANGEVAADISNRTNAGFTITPLENCIIEGTATLIP